MRYLSLFSGIEAASVAWEPLGWECAAVAEKECFRCKTSKPLDAFHRHAQSKTGRHSWCKTCVNLAQATSRKKNGRHPSKRAWLIKSRYGLTEGDVDRMREEQKDLCAICQGPMKRMCIDHCHSTGRVRGLLCHPCNVKLAAIENTDFAESARRYLDHPPASGLV